MEIIAVKSLILKDAFFVSKLTRELDGLISLLVQEMELISQPNLDIKDKSLINLELNENSLLYLEDV